MKGYVTTLLGLLLVSAPVWAQRANIETNERHNVSHAEWRIKGSPMASMEVAGVKIVYPQIAVEPIPGFTSVGGNIKAELAQGEIRPGLEGVLKKIGTLETTKHMRVLDVNHKGQSLAPGKYDLGFEYQPTQKMWALQLSQADQAAANVPLFVKEGSTPVETLSMTLTTMPGETIEVKPREEYRYEASGIRVNVRWGDLDGTTMVIGFTEGE